MKASAADTQQRAKALRLQHEPAPSETTAIESLRDVDLPPTDTLLALAVGSYPPEEEGAAPTPLPYTERMEIHAGLPYMLHDLHCHRLESLTAREPIRRAATPERNDPCPRGSGRKNQEVLRRLS